ncbi:uncharacterized protein CANTADRAFT_26429 [Suhomyces tanzawaensis NRRL Y-17324]|uniref:Uncharacterized protein n=1 Tax=Suhomyces tanzawaensis NRRL Y-17324 TaxID=984487 RepID=A0A1E4SFG8_9ASCO|nr:uncharacterized protein CANTADRAFT_26429 [Suhomyces tanzawaensis NRRL Y-17324]ODV78251.1 hypothetical protein CANTADRAFT_26429 [Suhomyces tanzawaensis NRRL Y-17324]
MRQSSVRVFGSTESYESLKLPFQHPYGAGILSVEREAEYVNTPTLTKLDLQIHICNPLL